MYLKRTFYLKNMISKSCIKLIEVYFGTLDFVEILDVKLGHVAVKFEKNKIEILDISNHFEKIGFSEIVNPDIILVEKIKLAAIELIYLANNTNSLLRNSDYISERVQEPYSKIGRVFSSVTNMTLEKYLILLKVEKTKELIQQNEYSFSEISYMLGYSSVQYLSNQFKKITGYTLTQYKKLENPIRIPLEKLI